MEPEFSLSNLSELFVHVDGLSYTLSSGTQHSDLSLYHDVSLQPLICEHLHRFQCFAVITLDGHPST